MRMDHELKTQTRNLFAAASLALAVIFCLTPCHGSAAVLEDGQYWIGRYGANPWNIQPSVEFGELEIAGDTWTHTSQTFPSGGSFNPHDGFDLGMTVIMPKAENPVADDFDGHWIHVSLQTGTNGQPWAAVYTADVTLDAAGTGTHQNPGGDPDPFGWSVDPASATVTVDLDDVSVDVGVAHGGLMFRAGLAIGESDPDDLAMDLFIKTGSDRDEQEAVGCYAVQVLDTDEELSQWNSYQGTLSLNADNTFHIDFEPDAMGHEPDGWSDDGTWSMDTTGYISFQSPGDENPVFGQLSLEGHVIVATDPAEDDGDDCSLIIATHVVPVPEPSVLLLLISAGPILLFVRRK